MKVLYLSYIPSPYRVDFFSELGKLCDLTVLFEKAASSTRDESWQHYTFNNFEGVVLQGKGNPAFIPRFSVKKYLKSGAYDKVIVHNMSTPTGMYAIRYLKKHKIPYWIEGDGGIAKNGKGFKERIKKYCLSNAEGYFSTGTMHDQYYLAYGAQQEKLYHYPFTSIKEDYLVSAPLTKEEKQTLRESLGMEHKRVVLSVGQFIHRKGFDLLLQAAHELPRDIGFYFVGGEPTEEYLRLKEELGLDNVRFIGFKSREELKKYYQAADMFVLPTREDIWGLVINEAMANGLPVITTDHCVAGIELIKDYQNGFLVPINDVQALRDRIAESITDDAMLQKLSKNSLQVIQEYTIENMAKQHFEVWQKK